MVTRVSTYSFHQTTVQNAMNVQNDILNISQQISSGTKTQNFKGLGGQVQVYLTVQDQLSRAAAYTSNNTQVNVKLNVASQALGQITTIANDAKNLILQARTNSQADNLAFVQQMKSFFGQIAQQMNSTDGNGSYLFSGSRIDQPPIDGSNYPVSEELGEPDDHYYLGNDQDINAVVGDGQTVTTNVKGNDIGFQQIMAAFSAAKEGFEKKDDSIMQKAYTLMQQGISRLTAVQTTINATSAQVEQTETLRVSQVTYWKTLKDNTVSADVVALSTQLATDQGVLQAAFQAFARISNLKLSDYLN